VIPDPAPPFELDTSGVIRERIRRMLNRATALGIAPEVERTIAEIVNLLIQKPREWGDPLRDYRHAKFTEYRGRHRHFQCIYVVHQRIPSVILTQIITLPGNPLHGENFDG
jgi:hypothetical protein